jgi:hypothetical protein
MADLNNQNRHTSSYWRVRANEVRARATYMRTPPARMLLLDVADRYERLAGLAAEVEAKWSN